MNRNIVIIWTLLSLQFINCTRQETVIKFWHFWSEPQQAQVVKEIVAKFERENHCKVQISELSWNDGKTKLILAFNSRTAPDVLELGSDWVAQFSSAEILEPLDTSEFKISRFLDYTTHPGKFNGILYAIPWTIGTRVLFCNLELMEKCGILNPPKSLDELLEYSRKINDSGIGYGFGANGSDPHRLYKKILPLIWTYGGEIIDTNGNININIPASMKAFQTYFQLSRAGIIETQKQIDLYFIQGKVAFCFSGEWLLTMINQSNSNLRFETCLMPGINGKPGISFAGGEYLAINAESKHKDLSKKLINFLIEEKNLIDLCNKIPSAGFPPDTNALKKLYNINNQHKATFLEQLKYSKMTPVHPRWIEIEPIIEKALVEVIFQKKGIPQSIQEAQRQIEIFNKNIFFNNI